mgnify:CR=1 FL=1
MINILKILVIIVFGVAFNLVGQRLLELESFFVIVGWGNAQGCIIMVLLSVFWPKKWGRV